MKRRLARLAILGFGGVVLFCGVLAIIVWRKPGTVQDWIGAQIQNIANGYLNPKLSFTDLRYVYPLEVSLKNLRLTADDPAHPGHTIDIIACDQAEVSLAEIPSVGKPIVIERISLDDPLISAVAVEPRSKKFVGFADLLRGGSSSSQTTTSSSAPPKLSDVFRMRLVEIKNGKIVYDPRIPGTVPMTLDQINTLLAIKPSEEGWYSLDTDIARKPVLDLRLKGQLNLDSFSVKDVDINLLADLGREKLDYLPPEIQALLKQYDAKGKLQAEVTGSMPILDPLSGQASLSVNLEGANLALSGMRIPVQHLELKTSYSDGKVTLPKLSIEALGGSADLSGSIALNDRLDADLRLAIAGMVPQELLANPEMRCDSPAKLNLKLSLATSLRSLLGKVPGITGQPLASLALSDFRVWASDPVNAGQDLDLVACKKLDVELDEPIVSGRPIVVDKIALDHPVISAVSVSPGALQFVGIPNFPERNAPQSAGGPSNATAPAMGKISDIIRVKSLQLTGAKLIYDPRIPGTQRMCLDRIDTTINIDPGNPGAYQIAAELAREPVFDLGVKGKIDLDDPALQDINLHLAADLTQDQLDFLPPQLQLILRRSGAKAKLNFDGNGSVAMSDLSHATCKFDTDIQNIEFDQGSLHIPIKDFKLSARLENRTVWQKLRIAALNNIFDFAGSVALNDRMDTDVTLTLNDLQLESLLAALKPNAPVGDTSTKLSAQIEIKSPLMVALGAAPQRESEPIATVDVRNLRLTTDNPQSPGTAMDFVACDELGAALSAVPPAGKPVVIDYVRADHPAIRAIATTRGSSDFAGFVALQGMAGSGATPTTAPSSAPAPAPPGEPRVRISDLIQLHSLAVTNASIFYDPQIDNTVPLSFDDVTANVNLDSLAGDAYRFDVLIPSKPDFALELGGRLNVDSLVVDPVTLKLTTVLGGQNPKYFPPQVQVLMAPYSLMGHLGLSAKGTLPLLNPGAGEFYANVTLDDFAGTFGAYRIPVTHLRLPLRIDKNQVEFFDSSPLGGPTLEAFDGTLNLTGTMKFDNQLDSTLSIHADNILLQDLIADKIAEPRMTLLGTVQADIELWNAPLLAVAAEATPPPQPQASPPAPGDNTAPQAMSISAPVHSTELPPYWGWAEINLTHAYLAKIELMQGVSDFAKSAFTDLFNKNHKPEEKAIVPKESAYVVCTLDKDHLDFSQIHYEAEDFAADGKGFITLEQQMDLHLTGGLFQKLGGLGGFGNEIKQISDSLLTYHIYGSFANIQYDVKRGDGKPIVLAAKKVTKEGEKYIGIGLDQAGKGLNKAGQFLGGLFNHKKNQDQSQTQPSQ